MLNYISGRDHELMRWMNQWKPSRWFQLYMLVATRLGDFWVYIPGVFLLNLYGGANSGPTLRACLVSGFSCAAICRILKRVVNRRRPSEAERPAWTKVKPPDRFSFPSLHTAIAFAVAVPLSLAYPPIWAPLALLASSIGLSRIVLGMHFLSDVVAGTLIGAALGAITLSWLGPA